MKPLLFALAVLLLLACDKNDSTFNGGLNGSWVMVKVTDHQNSETFTRQTEVRDVVLVFEVSGQNTGTISGHTCSNEIFPSPFSINDQQEFSIRGLGTTDVNEPFWGRLLVDNIGSLNHYDIVQRKLLHLYSEQHTFEFRKQ